jgi:hypothetical protein
VPAQDSLAPQGQPGVRRIAVRFFLLIGILSFFEDFTYRRLAQHSWTAEALGATAMVVGIVTGFSELLVGRGAQSS